MQKKIDWIRAPKDAYCGEVATEFVDAAQLFSRLQSPRATQGGAACVVYFQGQKVLDIYIGQKSATEAWQQDTLSVCYSTGKGVLATLAHILVSRGMIEYDQPIAQYWPEFAQNNKAHITLRHILSHQSGVFDIRHVIEDATEMLNWQHMLTVIAQAKPRFLAAQDAAYQPLTFGWLLGGVLQKATGQALATLMQYYLVEPLQLNGAYFGVPASIVPQVAVPFGLVKKQIEEQKKQKPIQKPAKKRSVLDHLLQWSGQDPQDFQDAMIPRGMKNLSFFSEAGLKAVIPAANGVFNAESLAKIYAMLAQGGIWQERQLIAPATFTELRQIQYRHRDRVMPIPMHWRLGYHRILTLGKSSTGFGHMGFNGSGAWCDPERGLSFAYTHNFATGSITGDYRLWALSQEVLRCADNVLKGRKGWF